jgi:predicted MFS family arabinose efflux permease
MDDDSSQIEETVQEDTTTSEKLNKTFVSTLVLANLVTSIPILITSLLLIEISQTFGIEVGTANQVLTVASTASVIMGLLMGGLSIQFKHKSLYLVGLVFLCLSALSSYLAPTFIVLLLAFAVYGISRGIVRPIGQALIGRFFSLHQRPKTMAYFIVGAASAYLIGSSLTNVISDWKMMFLLFLLPVAIITLLLAFKGIPPTQKSDSSSQQYSQAFKDVLFNKSALACLIGNVLRVIPANAVMLSLASSFYRQTFMVDKLFMSFAFIGGSMTTIVGSLIGGRLVNKIGRKRLTVISSFLLGALTLSFINIPNLWLSLLIWFISGLPYGIVNTAYASLALEQAPDNRATMMSLSQVSMYVAIAIGNALAGILLLSFNYNIVSLMGIFSFIGATVFHFFTIDPTQQAKH